LPKNTTSESADIISTLYTSSRISVNTEYLVYLAGQSTDNRRL